MLDRLSFRELDPMTIIFDYDFLRVLLRLVYDGDKDARKKGTESSYYFTKGRTKKSRHRLRASTQNDTKKKKLAVSSFLISAASVSACKKAG